MKDFYEINPYTMALVAKRNEYGAIHTCVIEVADEFFVKQKPLSIIDHSCKYFGASLKGRMEGTREIAGITHKPPIAIDPTNGIYMFPTHSPNKPICAWISHSYISQFEVHDKYHTLLTFKNGKTIILPISRGSFENQLNRTAQFRFLLTERLKQTEI